MNDMSNYSSASIALVGTSLVIAMLRMLASKGVLSAAEVRQVLDTVRAELPDQSIAPAATSDALALIDRLIASQILVPKPV